MSCFVLAAQQNEVGPPRALLSSFCHTFGSILGQDPFQDPPGMILGSILRYVRSLGSHLGGLGGVLGGLGEVVGESWEGLGGVLGPQGPQPSKKDSGNTLFGTIVDPFW